MKNKYKKEADNLEPHALVQFAIVMLFGIFFMAVLLGYCA